MVKLEKFLGIIFFTFLILQILKLRLSMSYNLPEDLRFRQS